MTIEPLPESSPEQTIARIEALLFVAAGAVSPFQLATALDVPLRVIELCLVLMEQRLGNNGSPRGLRLQRHGGRIQLTTSPDMSADIERFLGLEISNRLSKAALETLAIIAYQQPVTRPEIDAVRGVNSDGVLKSLLSKGLVQEIGRAERPGRPILYTTSPDFLSHFGLSSLEELPPLSFDLIGQDSQANYPDNDEDA